MPDLFKGEMLVAFGKYTGKGAAAVKVTGTLGGEKREFVTDVNFTENDTKNEFIPRLWATRRVGWLLDEIRKNGENSELKDEVVRLARRHGIVTPYTAYLILEDERVRNVPVAVRTMREFESDRLAVENAKAVYEVAAKAAKDERFRGGDLAVANAHNIQELRRSDNLQQAGQELALQKSAGQFGGMTDLAGTTTAATPGLATGGGAAGVSGPSPEFARRAAEPATSPADSYALSATGNKSRAIRGTRVQVYADGTEPVQGYRANMNYANQARVVKGRAFYQNGNTWTDATAVSKPDLKKQEVKFNSDEYFALLTKYPEAAAWLSLGNEVDVVLGDTLVSVR
jgi:Ca-activated chloride channel family protein